MYSPSAAEIAAHTVNLNKGEFVKRGELLVMKDFYLIYKI
jgi:hypothetical protein